MLSEEEAWRAFVGAYDIDVSEERVKEELDYITLEMRHRMQYDRLTGGDSHLFAREELAAHADELRAAALFEAKEPLVLARIIEEQGIDATPDELQAEARAMAEREGSTLEMVARFFGDDFALLARDVRERKARAWALSQQPEPHRQTKG